MEQKGHMDVKLATNPPRYCTACRQTGFQALFGKCYVHLIVIFTASSQSSSVSWLDIYLIDLLSELHDGGITHIQC